MSPRKRKLTATSKHTSKRVKRSSLNINNTQSTEDSKEIISVKSQDKFYKLKDILDEKRGKYLIDWEDDPDTGEKYSPSWEPKAHANAEAVAYWNTKKSVLKNSRKRSVCAPQSQAPYNPSSSSEQAPDTKTSHTDRARQNAIDLYLPVTGEPEITQDRIPDSPSQSTGEAEATDNKTTNSFISFDSQTLPLITADQLGIAVQIPPHSSIDPRLYPQFSSQALAGTAQTATREEEDQADSGLGESSPTPSILPWAIPDSQSLEESSSYVVSQIQTDADLESTQNSIHADSSAALNPDLNASTSQVTDPNDSIESLSNSESTTPASAHGERRLSISRNGSSSQVPLHSSFEEVQPSESTAPQLHNFETANEDLDELPEYENLQQEASTTSTFRTSSRVLSPRRPVIPNLPSSVDQHTAATSSQVELTQTLDPSVIEGDNCLPFGSQVPFAANSGTDEQQENIDSSIVEQLWQDAQANPAHCLPSSELASYDSRKTPTSVPLPRETKLDSLAATHTFVNPQDLVVSRPLETIDNSILNQRNPNSRSPQPPNSIEQKEITPNQTIEPYKINLEEISSTPLHEVPLQPPETPASNPPPRPVISSEASMSDKTPPSNSLALTEPQQPPLPNMRPGPTLGEKLRNMRAQSAAKLAAKKAASRASLQSSSALYTSSSALQPSAPITQRSQSPSLIPQRTSSEPMGDSRLDVRAVDVPLHPRATQTDTYLPSRPSKLAMHREISQVQGTKAFDMPRLGRMEFVVPLPAPASVRDQYVAMINHVGKDIQRFNEYENPDVELIVKMENFIREITNVTTHTDLVDDTVGNEDMLAADLAVWAKIRSSKFEFLDRIIEYMRDCDEHIAIVARGGRLLDILETFLKGKHISFDRPDILSRSDVKETKGRLHISIITSGEEEFSTVPKAADLVIAFDGSFNADEAQIHALRNHMVNVGQLSPVVHLLIYSSAEHIQKCLPEAITGVERLKLLVSCITFAREQVGELRPEESTVDACAEEVSIFVKSKLNSDHWTVPNIKPIEIDGITWDSSQDVISRTQSEPRSFDYEPSTVSSKRSLDVMEQDVSTQKRHRTTPGADITHISDSIAQSSQAAVNELRSTLHEAQVELNRAREALQGAQHEIANLKASHASREAIIQAAVTSSEFRLQERVSDLEELQTRYEDQYTAYHTLRHEKDDLVEVMARLQIRNETQAVQIETLKEEQKRIVGELQEARTALTLSTVPERAELEKALTDVRELSETQEHLQRKVSSLTTDFEFTRQQYQNASSSAAESASKVMELQGENVELRRKASGQAVRLRELNKTVEEDRLRKRIEQLELMVKDRDQILDRREREVRGRGVQTRAGSVQPRSPKPSSRAGSRAASPLPGLLAVSKPTSGLRFG